MKTFTISIILLSFLSSCSLLDKEPTPETSGYPTSNYISGIVRPGSINNINTIWDSSTTPTLESFNANLRDKIFYLFIDGSDTLSHEQREAFYDQFGDTLFSKTSGFDFNRFVFYDTLEAINIYVNRAYDTKHLENSNVNDLFDITYANPIPFVLNGYSYDGLDYPYTSSPIANNDCMKEGLIDFNNRKDKVGICISQFLELNQAPSATDTFQFRIVYTFANDKTYETTTPNAILMGE